MVTKTISLAHSIIFGTLIGVTATIGLLANIVVGLAILGDKKLRKSAMNMLLLNLVRVRSN